MKKLIVVMVAVWAVTAVPLQAQANDAEAKEAYKKGRALYKAGKYAEAVVELKRAYALKPHPSLLRYMGDTYYKLNDARKAIEHYKKYLKEAPQAADKEKVEGKVRQLELVVGASEEEEEEETTPLTQATETETAPPPPLPAETKSNIDMAPTGEDKEVPMALRHRDALKAQQAQQAQQQQQTEGTSAVSIMKWVAAGVGVAGLVTGIIFNRMAAGEASDLEDAVKNGCPPTDTSCGGNPDMNRPKIQFNEVHFDMQQAYNRNNTISIAGFVAGGVGAAAAVIMFIVDKPKRGRRASVTPVFAKGFVGLTGGVTF
jgi:tetratricopeptide (TPR) repeat protein